MKTGLVQTVKVREEGERGGSERGHEARKGRRKGKREGERRKPTLGRL